MLVSFNDLLLLRLSLTVSTRRRKRNLPHIPMNQVCSEVFSPPMSMFITPSDWVATEEASHAATASGGGDDNKKPSNEETTTSSLDVGAVPDPLFASRRPTSSALCMDTERVGLYRSLGIIAGLAVRTGVPMPFPRLAPRWWMLVAEEEEHEEKEEQEDEAEDAREEKKKARGERQEEGNTSGDDVVAARTKSEQRWIMPSSSGTLLTAETPAVCAIEGVLGTLGKLSEEAAETGKLEKALGEVLIEARFVGPLSNGQVMELLPGGE